jgi:hypothetical protein
MDKTLSICKRAKLKKHYDKKTAIKAIYKKNIYKKRKSVTEHDILDLIKYQIVFN